MDTTTTLLLLLTATTAFSAAALLRPREIPLRDRRPSRVEDRDTIRF